MSMTKTSEKEIVKLFNELKEKTNNFKNIKPEVFLENPKRILIIRLIFNMGQKEFAKFSNISFQALCNWELNKRRPAKWKILNVLNRVEPEIKKFNNIAIEEILKNFRKFKEMSEGLFKNPEIAKLVNQNKSWDIKQKYSIRANKSKRRTYEENEISTILSSANIIFLEQFPIIDAGFTKAGSILVDFIIISNNMKIVIETCRLNGKKRMDNSSRQALKSFRIKKFYPEIKTICAVKTNESEHRAIHILKETFDLVIINDFSNIPQIIEKMSAESGTFRV